MKSEAWNPFGSVCHERSCDGFIVIEIGKLFFSDLCIYC
jgi:hypothetical protein